MSANQVVSKDKLHAFLILIHMPVWLVGWLVGCIEDLRRFPHYFSHIATWKQEITNLKIQVARPGIEPRWSSCSASHS